MKGRILSDPKYTIMIRHCVHKTAVLAPWKSLSNQLQSCRCPRSKYAFVVLWRGIAIIKDLCSQRKKKYTSLQKYEQKKITPLLIFADTKEHNT